ncbi:hypothetical protein EU527_03650 [Candidatus Thorarchaeota archaeon]|nr:MAG: hypothetical protein EU527_03650 [Candidatus Thorarchaeota archaeon]
MMIESISALIHEIREEFGFNRGIQPTIENVYEHDDGSLHIITPDRSEKSLLLGPGGRISTELAKRISKKITVYGQDEILVREHRLGLTLRRINEIFHIANTKQQDFLELLRNLIKSELSFPMSDLHPVTGFCHDSRIAVAYSGGIDSSATICILNEHGIQTDAITIQLGPEFCTYHEMSNMQQWCHENKIKHILIQPLKDVTSIIQATRESRIHPCGKCHDIISEAAREFATKNQYPILITGELLPSGRQSILLEDSLLIIHLPAALALSKYRTEQIAEKSGKRIGRKRFGCLLIGEANKKGWRNVGPSILRVLRELEGGVLTTGQGLEYIKNIVRPWINRRI